MPVPTLVTPIGSNFIRDFVAQNTINCDRIDEFAGPCLTSDALNTYTPTLFGVTTAPVIGSGGGAVNRAYYYQIFDQIYVWGELKFGSSGASFGSGIWSIGLPFTARSVVGASTTLGSSPIVGTGSIFEDSGTTDRRPLTVHLRTTSQVMFGIKMGSGFGSREVSNTIPIAWTAGDGLQWCARYKRLS